jgi:RNA polymerase sigma-70 factor (ECF subfamily)
MALGSGFVEVIGQVSSGADESFDLLYRDLQPGLGRYGAFLLGEADPELSTGVWLELVERLPSFDGPETDLRAIAFGLVRRRATADPRHRLRRSLHGSAGRPDAGGDPIAHSVGNLTPLQAVATIDRLLPAAQAEAVVLQVLSDLDTELVAHVLATTTGAVRLAHHRALAGLCERVAPRLRRGWSCPDDPSSDAVDLSDRTPQSVFRGGLPAWQAHGHLAEVARLVNAARRAPLADEVAVPDAVRAAVAALRSPGPAPGPASTGRGRSVSARLAAVLASVARSAEPVVAVRSAGPGAPRTGDERSAGAVYAEPDRPGPS